MSRETGIPLPVVDSAWLRMEQPDNLMTITGVMLFDRPLDFERLRALIRDRLLSYDRFRMKVVHPDTRMTRPRFVEDPTMDLDRHLHRLRLPGAADERELERFVSARMSAPLDPDRPLWECHYVENLGSGSAVVTRLHHCIADGMALVQVLLHMADSVPDGVQPPPVGRTSDLDARGPWSRVAVLGGLAAKAGASLVRLFTMRSDPDTVMRGGLGNIKRAVWSDPIPLDRIKQLGRRRGGTVNDVLLAAVAGALRRYLQGRGEPVAGFDLRVVIPVNLRGPDDLIELGNRFGLVVLALPVGLANAGERFREVKRRMDSVKQSAEPLAVYGALRALGAAGSRVQGRVIRFLSAKATAVMTNVPGPRKPLYLCGERIRDFMFWVPQSGRLGLGISVLSYVDRVRIGVASDVGLIPDPEAIVEAFRHELEELGETTDGSADQR